MKPRPLQHLAVDSRLELGRKRGEMKSFAAMEAISAWRAASALVAASTSAISADERGSSQSLRRAIPVRTRRRHRSAPAADRTAG